MKKELNEYLFFEFGFDINENDSSSISEDWPFHLTELGNVHYPDGDDTVFEFEDNGEKYYAIYGRCLTFFSAEGIDFPNLKRQLLGSAWIGAQNPVSLETSYIDHPTIPRLNDRRKRFEELGNSINKDEKFEILEGLFLEKTKKHLAIIQFKNHEKAEVIGDNIRVRNVPFNNLSPSIRLSIAIGMLIEKKKLG